jgi:hypothetical protein
VRGSVVMSKNRNYKYSSYLGIALSGLLLAFYLASGHSPFISEDFIASEWFLELLPIPLFVSTIISGTTYIGKTCDLLSEKAKQSQYEKILTPIFLLAGVTIGIVLSILFPLAKSVIAIFDSAVFTLNCLSSVAGFGNRLGAICDTNKRPTIEKGIIAVVIGVAMIGVCLTLIGVTSFFSGGAFIPAWLAAFMYVSNAASTADYSAKTLTKCTPHFWKSKKQKKAVVEKPYEYTGSRIGVLLGIAIAVIIIVATHGLGLIPILAIFNMSMGGLGGLFSRLGRLMDMKQDNQKKPTVILHSDSLNKSTSQTLLKKLNVARHSESSIINNQQPIRKIARRHSCPSNLFSTSRLLRQAYLPLEKTNSNRRVNVIK